MNRAGKWLTVFLLAAVGLWGCSQANTAQSSAQAEKIKALEAKVGKLEDDYKSVQATRDAEHKRADALKEENGQLKDQQARLQKDVEAGKLAAKERDALKQEVESRTGERDALAARCDKMKKGLQELIGQDNAMSAPAHPTTTEAGVAGGGQ